MFDKRRKRYSTSRRDDVSVFSSYVRVSLFPAPDAGENLWKNRRDATQIR